MQHPIHGAIDYAELQQRGLVASQIDDFSSNVNPLGTPTGLVVRKYLNEKKVPQLFVGAGATMYFGP